MQQFIMQQFQSVTVDIATIKTYSIFEWNIIGFDTDPVDDSDDDAAWWWMMIIMQDNQTKSN